MSRQSDHIIHTQLNPEDIIKVGNAKKHKPVTAIGCANKYLEWLNSLPEEQRQQYINQSQQKPNTND